MKLGKTVYFTTPKAWRAWLAKQHATAPEIWFIFYRKATGKKSLPYGEAVEEALCFGWIDSQVKNVDAERYAQRFSPRRTKSAWSDANKVRMRRLIKEGRMTPAGLAVIDAAAKKRRVIPAEIMAALKSDAETWKNFQAFPASYKEVRIGWIAAHMKDRPAEYRKRLAYFLKMTKKNKRFGGVQ